ncbi:MAG TPA: YqgE/AlgH family protein [Bacteroidales bacterium]|nr:YqgE/AlgH family protein [Bacteroidales bacterium]HPS16939.1 YqgE/AlgH family protein [Bacteroidales bacterium]
MNPANIKPAQGTLLISEPFLKDFYFRRSVVLLAEHDENGSFGLIINKPLEIKLNEVIVDFPEFDADVYLGGPVKTDSLFVLHTIGNKIPNSLKIIEGLYWGGDINTIKKLVEEKKINKKQIRFFIGYSGWDPDQLNNELKENSWVIKKLKSEKILKEPPAEMWKNLIISLGDEYSTWLNYPLDPMMN